MPVLARKPARLVLAIGLVALVACGSLRAAEDDAARGPDAAAGFGDGTPDAASDAAAAARDGSTSAADGGAKPDAGDAAPISSSGLDPGVAIPALDQQVCSHPGRENECPFLHPCRIATPDAGRCDDCVAQGTCGGGVKSVCQDSRDCDVLFQCFRNRCTLFCTLPDGAECGGAPNTCVDVGHVTTGLCDPAKL